MLRKKEGEIQWLEFELFQEFSNLKQATFLRHGGISQGPFATLNVSDTVGDEPSAVVENRKRIQKILNLPHLVFANQVHGKEIKMVTPNMIESKPACDALALSEPNIGAVIVHADCQAAIFYDPIHHKAVNVHAGWKGSVQNIYRETISFMHQTFKSDPKELLVGISPSLGPEDAEFKDYQNTLPEEFWEFQVKPNYFDFWAISKKQLTDCGILPHHIEIAEISTFSHSEDCFSFRKEKITGRHATIIALE